MLKALQLSFYHLVWSFVADSVLLWKLSLNASHLLSRVAQSEGLDSTSKIHTDPIGCENVYYRENDCGTVERTEIPFPRND